MRELLSKRLTEPCRPELTSCCPSMDLVATVTQRNTVDVWRWNGQRVFGLARDEDEDYSVSGLAWKSDGHILAVALSNGTVSLIDSFSGKVTHNVRIAPENAVNLPDWSLSQQSPQSAKAPEKVTSTLFWSTHFVHSASTRTQIQDAGTNIALDDLLGLNTDIGKLLKVKPNLPRQLAQLDMETSLPKLSTLPATGADDDVFSSRNSVDTIFHPQSSAAAQQKVGGDIVDVLLARTQDCFLHIRIFDSLEIGNIDVSQSLPNELKGKKIVQHASHPLLSTHFFVTELEDDGHAARSGSQTKDKPSLHLTSLDLRFATQRSYNLPLLATKATQLQNLLRYMSQIQLQLSQEVRTAFDLPTRFLRNVNESLAEQDSTSSFTSAAYHLILTGTIDPRLKEWLVDEVGERGLKRWEKAVGDCLDLIRRMMSECLLPAIERCHVVISRLDGLARFSDTATRLGLDEKGIRSVRETLDVLTILCEDLLRDVCVEGREFAAFMRWIRWEAEVEALEEGSERAEEMRESYSGESELQMVLDYIAGGMQKSRVLASINILKDEQADKGAATPGHSQLYENYKQARRKSIRAQLPKLGDLVQLLKDRSNVVFTGIADSLRKSILSSYIAELDEDSDTSVMDCEVIQSAAADEAYEVCILVRRKSRKGVMLLYTSNSDSKKGPTSMVAQECKVPGERRILDLKFTGDGGFFALVRSGNDKHLLWQAMGREEWETRYHFPNGMMTGGMTPARLEVNGRKGRRTVTVVDEAGAGFVVLSLDT